MVIHFTIQAKHRFAEISNKHKNTDTNISTADCVKEQENVTLPSDNKPSSEDCVITIIKTHKEAIT
jgi:hypothetical protein